MCVCGGGGGCRPGMGEDVHINEGVQHWINAAVDFKGNSILSVMVNFLKPIGYNIQSSRSNHHKF